MRWLDYQLSRLETVFAVIVLLIILSALLNRVVTYFTLAERALVDNVITNMNAALRLEVAHLLASGQADQLGGLEYSNPVRLVESRPSDYASSITGRAEHAALINVAGGRPMAGYAGEEEYPDPSTYSRGSWYFDKGENTLVYVVRNRELFRSSLEGPERIRFRVELDYGDRNNNGKYEPGIDEYRGIHLRPVDEYEWMI